MKTIIPNKLRRIDILLRELNFIKVVSGKYVYGDFNLKVDNSWLVLGRDVPRELHIDPLTIGQTGCPGLWKYVTSNNIIKSRFELPPDILIFSVGNNNEDTAGSVFKEMISWAILTADQKTLPKNWSVPSLQDTGFTKNDFAIQHGRFIRHIRLINENQTLSLRMTILSLVPEIHKDRLHCLRRTLIDAQNRWHMVRIALGQPGQSITAEINFSGAPKSILEILIRTGLNILSEFFKWIVASVDFLADTGFQSNIFQYI
jgi:hypothetical protein